MFIFSQITVVIQYMDYIIAGLDNNFPITAVETHTE